MRLNGYVWQEELAKECGVHHTKFSNNKNLMKKEAGGTKFIKIDSLEPEYQEIAKRSCTSLKNLYPAAQFFSYAGVSPRFDQNKDLKFKYIGKIKMLEFDEDFFNLQENHQPYIITRTRGEEFAKLVLNYQGLKIGFY